MIKEHIDHLHAGISRCVFIDIETLPTDREDVVEYIDKGLAAPGNYKKPESIEKWNIEERPGVLAAEVAKTSFEGGLGRVASIAFAVGDGKVRSDTSASAPSEGMPAVYSEDAERSLISRFFNACQYVYDRHGCAPTLVGHNISHFDIRWLWKRSVVLEIRTPAWWPLAAKPWDKDAVFDTMTAWEGPGGRISQDRLCLALGLPMKTNFDDSMVAQAWADGEIEKIREYDAQDVETVRSIWKRLTLYSEPPVEDEELPPLLVPAAAEPFLSGASA